MSNLATLALALLLFACAAPTAPPPAEDSSPFTHGNAQLKLVKGETTQAEVLEVFGAPNVATIDGGGREVWTYQKHATVSSASSSSSYWTVVLLGGEQLRGQAERSSRSMTLILKFDETDTLYDFRSRSTSF